MQLKNLTKGTMVFVDIESWYDMRRDHNIILSKIPCEVISRNELKRIDTSEPVQTTGNENISVENGNFYIKSYPQP